MGANILTIQRTKIIIEGGQINSIEDAKQLAFHLSAIEKLIGVHDTYWKMNDCFISPDVDLNELKESDATRNKKLYEVLINYKK